MKYIYELLKNKKAFTLIETVVSLFIVSVTSLLLFSSIKIISSYFILQSGTFYQYIQSVNYLEQVLSNCELLSVEANQVVCKVDNKQYIIEFYKDMLRKKSIDGGHEPILVNISEGYFTEHNSLRLVVKMLDGKVYEKNFDAVKK